VLTLIHESGVSPVPFPQDGECDDVQVWRDHEGTVCAVGHTVAGRHWMHVPRIGDFAFGPCAGDAVHVFAEPSARPEWVLDTFHRMVLPLALQAQGEEVLHASAVRMPRGVVALCAVSETGKSTLAYGLSRRGFPLWADDAVAFTLDKGTGVTAMPLPFTIRLRPASAAYFGPQNQPANAATPAPLAAVCVLARKPAEEPGPDVEATRLTPARAFPAVLTHAYCFSLRDDARKRRMLQQYLDVCVRVPVFQVRFSAGLERIPEILDRLVESVEAAKRDAGPTPR
jgi:hypothetical protein